MRGVFTSWLADVTVRVTPRVDHIERRCTYSHQTIPFIPFVFPFSDESSRSPDLHAASTSLSGGEVVGNLTICASPVWVIHENPATRPGLLFFLYIQCMLCLVLIYRGI